MSAFFWEGPKTETPLQGPYSKTRGYETFFFTAGFSTMPCKSLSATAR